MVDRNNDDVVGTEDVTVYVNDLPVTVSDVNEKRAKLHWPPRQSPMPLLLPTTVLMF